MTHARTGTHGRCNERHLGKLLTRSTQPFGRPRVHVQAIAALRGQPPGSHSTEAKASTRPAPNRAARSQAGKFRCRKNIRHALSMIGADKEACTGSKGSSF